MFHRIRFILDRHLTIANLLDKAADVRPDQCLFSSDENLEHYRVQSDGVTTSELRALVNSLSNLYQAHGIRQFDRVGIWKANSLDYFFHSWAAMRLGAIAVPINGGMPVDILKGYLTLCKCTVLVTDGVGLSKLRTAPEGLTRRLSTIFATSPPRPDQAGNWAAGKVVSVPTVLSEFDTEFTPPHMNHDQDVLICHTSGTTGIPKGVLHGSRSLILAAKGQLRVQFITNRNVAMSAAWTSHHIALSGFFTSVAAGMHVHCMVNHDAHFLLNNIGERRVNVFFAFPDVYQRLCRRELEDYDLSTMRMWMTGGDAMHEVHIRRLVAHGRFFPKLPLAPKGSLFCELLGTSEVGMVALMKFSSTRTSIYGRCVGRRTPVSPKVKVANEIGEECAVQEVGRLMVKGPSLFKGYWNRHDQLHGVVRDGWWWTGDVAFRDRRGRVYQIDREVDVVATAEGPVYGLPVEEEALKLDGVLEAAVFAMGPVHDRKACLLVQVDPRVRFSGPRALAELRKVSRNCALIAGIEVVYRDEDIPRGLTGKVLKRHLRDRYAQQNGI